MPFLVVSVLAALTTSYRKQLLFEDHSHFFNQDHLIVYSCAVVMASARSLQPPLCHVLGPNEELSLQPLTCSYDLIPFLHLPGHQPLDHLS